MEPIYEPTSKLNSDTVLKTYKLETAAAETLSAIAVRETSKRRKANEKQSVISPAAVIKGLLKAAHPEDYAKAEKRIAIEYKKRYMDIKK